MYRQENFFISDMFFCVFVYNKRLFENTAAVDFTFTSTFFLHCEKARVIFFFLSLIETKSIRVKYHLKKKKNYI